MTITRVGTNQTYADGWDKAFAGKRGKSSPSKATPSKKAKPKKSAKKGRK